MTIDEELSVINAEMFTYRYRDGAHAQGYRRGLRFRASELIDAGASISWRRRGARLAPTIHKIMEQKTGYSWPWEPNKGWMW